MHLLHMPSHSSYPGLTSDLAPMLGTVLTRQSASAFIIPLLIQPGMIASCVISHSRESKMNEEDARTAAMIMFAIGIVIGLVMAKILMVVNYSCP